VTCDEAVTLWRELVETGGIPHDVWLAIELLESREVFDECDEAHLVAALTISIAGLDNEASWERVPDGHSPTVNESAVWILERLTGTHHGIMPTTRSEGRMGHEHSASPNARQTRYATSAAWQAWWKTAGAHPTKVFDRGRRAVAAERAAAERAAAARAKSDEKWKKYWRSKRSRQQ